MYPGISFSFNYVHVCCTKPAWRQRDFLINYCCYKVPVIWILNIFFEMISGLLSPYSVLKLVSQTQASPLGGCLLNQIPYMRISTHGQFRSEVKQFNLILDTIVFANFSIWARNEF